MKKNVYATIAASGVLVLGVIGFGLHANIIKLPFENITHIQFIAGLDNDRALVGFAHHMFVGRVVKQENYIQTDDGPATQFTVTIVDNIKGDLHGTVTVNQYGGYKNGVLYRVEEETPVLPGSTYLFTTRYYDNQHWLSAIPNGRKILSEDANISTEKLQAQIMQDPRVKQLKEAYKNEILLDSDVESNNAINNYQSIYGNK